MLTYRISADVNSGNSLTKQTSSVLICCVTIDSELHHISQFLHLWTCVGHVVDTRRHRYLRICWEDEPSRRPLQSFLMLRPTILARKTKQSSLKSCCILCMTLFLTTTVVMYFNNSTIAAYLSVFTSFCGSLQQQKLQELTSALDATHVVLWANQKGRCGSNWTNDRRRRARASE